VKHMGSLLMSATLVTTVLCPALCHADTVYSNLGPGSSYYSTGPSAVESGQYVASDFTVAPGSGYDLTEIEIAVALEDSFGNPNSVTVQLMSNAGGSPGTVLGSWVLNNVPSYTNTAITPAQTITGITGIALTAGTAYWLEASAGDILAVWDPNNTGALDDVAYSYNQGSTWIVDSGEGNEAFAIFGTPESATPAPEPSSLSLLLLGLGVLGLVSLWRRALSSIGLDCRTFASASR
jgi:hypothetical protein